MRVVSFKIEEDLFFMLEMYAKKKNTTKSEVIRRALKTYLMTRDTRPFVTRRMKIYT